MKLLRWCKANAMPVIAVLAAAVTAVFVPPDAAYLGYYDVKTLSCLLCVLAVVGALRRVDAGGVTGQPDHFPGIHKACQGADGAVHGAVLRHQLRFSRRPVGSHDTLDAVKFVKPAWQMCV